MDQNDLYLPLMIRCGLIMYQVV